MGVSNGSVDFITGGVRHIKFWTVEGRNAKPLPGFFGKMGKKQPLTCAADVDLALVTGTVTGHLYVWNNRTITRIVKAHTLTINDMFSTGDLLVTGSKDGGVKLWDKDIINLLSFNMSEAKPPPFNRSVRRYR